MQKVLIGHPDKNFRYELHKSLVAQKYVVIEADNGGAMFAITKMQQPNFIVAADGMPSLSTEDFLKKLRDVNLGHIPIVILTTRNNVPRNLLLMEMGAKEVMLEPIHENELFFHLKRLNQPFSPNLEKSDNTSEIVAKEVESRKIVVPQTEMESKTSGNPSAARAVNSSLLLRHAKCQFCKNETPLKLFTLRTRTMVTEADKFDVDCYLNSIGQNEFCDYSLLEVGVCPNCYFATNDFRAFEVLGLRSEEMITFSEFVFTAFKKKADDLKPLVLKCGKTMFTENRSPEDALVAIELAVYTLTFLYNYDRLKYGLTQNEIFQYALKSAAIAEKAHFVDIRNQKYQEAFQLGLMQMALKGELGVRRHTYQMYALSCFLRDKDNIKKYGKELFDALSKPSNTPQLRIKSREYADRAKKYFGWVEDEKFWV